MADIFTFIKIKDELEKRFKEKFTEEEISEISEYFAEKKEISPEKIKEMEDINKKYFKKEKEKLSKLENIEIYVSFISFAKTETWELSPVEKALESLNTNFKRGIKECYFLATKETVKITEKLKEKIEKKYKLRAVNIIELKNDDYDNLYNQIEVDVLDKVLEKYTLDSIIIDNTQGFKMISGVLYKFAVEQGIKLITWQSEQLEELNKRIPGTENLNFIEHPQLRNYTVVTAINLAIEKMNFEEAKNICLAINNKEKAEILAGLSKIFNMKNMINSGDFLESCEDYIEENISLKNKNLRSIREKFNKNFKNIFELYEISFELFEIIYFYLSYGFFKKNMFYDIENGKEKYENKDTQMENMIIEKLKETIENFGDRIKKFDIDKDENEGVYSALITEYDFLENVLENQLDDLTKKEILKIFKTEEKYVDINVDTIKNINRIFENIENLIKELHISLPRLIELDRNILKLKKYHIEIELKDSVDKNIPMRILKEIIDSRNYSIKREGLDTFVENRRKRLPKEENEGEEKFISKNYDDLKKYFIRINKTIKDAILEEKNENIEIDFINLDIKFAKLKELKISDEYIY